MQIELKEHWTTKAAPSDAFDAAHTVAVNAFGFYCVPEIYKTREVCRILTAGDANEPRTVSIIRRFCGTGDVVSGGAFVGDLLPAIADGLADGARLHSFEPNPVSFAAARYTLALNALQNVALHNVAVGKESAVFPLQINHSNGSALGGMSKIVPTRLKGRTTDVPVMPLDDLVDPSRMVSVLQLDVEGFEWPALLGARRIIEQNRPTIIVEALDETPNAVTEAVLSQAFPDLGYRCVGQMERNRFFRSLAP
jgi:FkbM family methyltransferase